MFTKYRYDTQKRRNSIIEDRDGSTYSAIGVPSAGKTADTRFFGKGNKKKFVVKHPKYCERNISFDADTIKKIDKAREFDYREEQKVWNLFYPDNQADIFTEGGLRLVLPCLPGDTLTQCLSNDELTCCQQLLSVAYEVQRFNKAGFAYSDFNTENVLIEQKSNGEFKAYLIDFFGIRNIDDDWGGGNQEFSILASLVPGAAWQRQYKSIDDLINGLIAKINTLTGKRSPVEKLFQSFNTLPETERNDLIKKFVEEFIFGEWRKSIFEELYQQDGLDNFRIREQFIHYLKKTSPSTYDRISQNVPEDEAIPISRLTF